MELRRGRNKLSTARSCMLAGIFLTEHEQPCSSFKTRNQADASLLVSMGTVTPMCKCCDLSDHLRTNRKKVGKELGLALLHWGLQTVLIWWTSALAGWLIWHFIRGYQYPATNSTSDQREGSCPQPQLTEDFPTESQVKCEALPVWKLFRAHEFKCRAFQWAPSPAPRTEFQTSKQPWQNHSAHKRQFPRFIWNQVFALFEMKCLSRFISLPGKFYPCVGGIPCRGW